MRINTIRTSVCAITLCVIFGGCSAEETPADPSLAAGGDQPGDSPNASAGDEGKKDGDADKKDGDADDGNNVADTDQPPPATADHQRPRRRARRGEKSAMLRAGTP